MKPSFADRKFIVTGGGRGIVKGAASAVVAAGGNAEIVGRNAERLAEAAHEIISGANGRRREVICQLAYITDYDAVARVVAEVTS